MLNLIYRTMNIFYLYKVEEQEGYQILKFFQEHTMTQNIVEGCQGAIRIRDGAMGIWTQAWLKNLGITIHCFTWIKHKEFNSLNHIKDANFILLYLFIISTLRVEGDTYEITHLIKLISILGNGWRHQT